MSKSVKARFGITMSPELLERVEEKRGLIPRATFIEHCLKQYLDQQNSGKDEIKFYDEVLAMLPEEENLPKVASKESYEKLRIIVENARIKILNRKKSLLPKRNSVYGEPRLTN